MRLRNPLNEVGAGVPDRSPYGQAVRRSVPILIHTPPPIVSPHEREGPDATYGNLFGAVLLPVPYVPPIVSASAQKQYTGQLPVSVQPTVRKPSPWDG